MRLRYKTWAEPYLKSHLEIYIDNLNNYLSFFSSQIEMEIGSGKGNFIIQKALKNSHINFLAIEKDISICGIMCKKIVENKISNIRLINDDFDNIFPFLKDHNIYFDNIYLNFSDPWPKRRHFKRRLTYCERLTNISSLLKVNCYLKFKTDNEQLYEFSKTEAKKISFLNLILDDNNYVFDENEDEMSEYEANFRKENRPIYRLIYQKRG